MDSKTIFDEPPPYEPRDSREQANASSSSSDARPQNYQTNNSAQRNEPSMSRQEPRSFDDFRRDPRDQAYNQSYNSDPRYQNYPDDYIRRGEPAMGRPDPRLNNGYRDPRDQAYGPSYNPDPRSQYYQTGNYVEPPMGRRDFGGFGGMRDTRRGDMYDGDDDYSYGRGRHGRRGRREGGRRRRGGGLIGLVGNLIEGATKK
ncbi:uncharacterized protein LY89DRAFT_781112 [Mollisia scopiformis]|uniref:Uncharacterized protein n=1 Tax=Mollisia scopiformis TaxID=149040 RepID=A0A194XE22_MOLSC|nr:uncharacterized protein LY89DRAFT_781112 [Mollisia scopiformis]KUJ18002.1 hypothetical protein LY89DRAFT_781112 [Mollisia scopiformis]